MAKIVSADLIKTLWLLFLIGVGLALSVIAYTIYDNNRIVVIRQEVQIEGLPEAFEGFTVLQISDLHGKRFGERQEKLVNLINGLDFDMIAITGDMNHYWRRDSTPLVELLRGIEHKEYVFYTAGNTGPFDMEVLTGKITADGVRLRDEGCILLDKPYPIIREGNTLWIAEYFSAYEADRLLSMLLEEEDSDEKSALQLWLNRVDEVKEQYHNIPNEDVLIAVTHFPLSEATLNDLRQGDFPHYDLVIAGHYHGGQLRLPLIGALWIPAPYLPRGGLFPPQDVVSGLVKGKNTQQYISRGLGASSRLPWLTFRLFNSPEVNLITLKRQDK
ncbi:MAG: hypothetical protein HPY45_18000 [Anaerolineae bacterium]|nr:hypothetical protein [Anaerolineae bacterium]